MRQTGEYSVKKRVLILLLILLGVVLTILMYYNYFAISELNKKTAEASSNTLYIQCQNMEKTMDSIAVAMVNLTSEQVPFQQLAYGPSGEYENYMNTFDTQQSVEDMMYPYSDWCCSVLISLPRGISRLIPNHGYSLGESGRQLQAALWELAEEGYQPGNIWFPVKAGGRTFLVRMAGYRSTYLFAAILPDEMILMQNNENVNQAVTLYFDENEIYTGNAVVSVEDLLAGEQEEYFIVRSGEKRWLVIESELAGSSLKAAYLTPQTYAWRNIGRMYSLLLVISICTLLTLPVGYVLLRRMFFRPLDRLVAEMEVLKGQQEPKAAHLPFREREFVVVDEAMHSMVDEISRLQTEKYEKELEVTQVQLEYYRVQIRPHFYINCLKSIYSMLEARQYHDIRRTIICLSNHLRYMLKEHRSLVPLGEEINYINNYIELQTISMQYPPECRILCDPDMEEYLIPAVSLLSFVENSVKYSAHTGGPLQIRVSAGRLKTEQETLVCFSVSDNGQGFEQEMLVKLNALDEALAEEGHIGILNVVRRFRLQYGDRVLFTFRNYEGAVNEIFISEGTYEASDCG